MASVDVPVALLGYGTVGSSVNRMLAENEEEIERATGHRLRVVKALVRDAAKQRPFAAAEGVLTTEFESIRDDPSIQVVAEVMGGLEPTGEHVLQLLRAGKSVVTANKQLLARRGAELFAAASEGGVQLRFEASVCAAIPVIKVLREALVASSVHRVLGIVNGTTNFILTRMTEEGSTFHEALAEAQELGYAERDPTADVEGSDAAARAHAVALTRDEFVEDPTGLMQKRCTFRKSCEGAALVVHHVRCASEVRLRFALKAEPKARICSSDERSHEL